MAKIRAVILAGGEGLRLGTLTYKRTKPAVPFAGKYRIIDFTAASNNDLNVLSEMSTAAKLHKAVSEDPTVLDAKTALLMATRWGAEVLGLGKVTGSIEEGKAADLVMVNLNKPHLIPLYNIYSHIVYAMRSSDVEMVMVDGRVVVNDGKLITAEDQKSFRRPGNGQRR